MGPLVSIGVAVYNVREYLCACLGSVCKQASEEIEILLVDDGSSDGSGEVCDAYAGQSPFVRAIHFPENRGICEVRNTILREAAGRWVFFVDGDDELPDWFSEVARSLPEHLYDVIFFRYAGYKHGKPQPVPRGENRIVELSQKVLETYCISCASGAPCQLPDIRLQQVRHTSVWARPTGGIFVGTAIVVSGRQQKSQDVLFNTLVYHACRSAAYIPTVMYYYRTHPNSICNRYHPDFLPGMELLMQRNLAHIDAFFPGRADVLDAFYRYRVIGILLDAMRLHVFHPDNPCPPPTPGSLSSTFKKPLFAYSLAHLNLDDYWLGHEFLLNCARKRRFALLNFAYRHPWVLRVYGGTMHRKDLLKDRFLWRRFQRNR